MVDSVVEGLGTEVAMYPSAGQTGLVFLQSIEGASLKSNHGGEAGASMDGDLGHLGG